MGEAYEAIVMTEASLEASKKLYPAIELLRDPQGLAELVLKRLRNQKYTHEVKMLIINFITRLVGNHELLLLPLYPLLQRYMGGHQRDVTAILAYTVQACHSQVPPQDIFGILKTVAHNFITERCSGEQMAVGINAVRCICARVPSILAEEDEGLDEEFQNAVSIDMEAFVRDLAGYAKHRDRSVSIAGRAFTNFVRDVHPSLLQGKDRGSQGSALHRAGVKPLKYGQQNVAVGVRGADLLVEYEAKKRAAQMKEFSDDEEDDSDGDEEDGIEAVPMKGTHDDTTDDDEGDEEAEASDGDDDDDDEEKEDEEAEESDEEAPQLVLTEGDDKEPLDLSKMSPKERKKLQQEVSSSRIFSAKDFIKMRKLVEREERLKRDPRAAAKRKRALAQGEDFDELTDEDDDDDSDEDDDEDEINTPGMVNPWDIQADAKRKRQSKAERLEKVLSGRSKFESKTRQGGSTNVEKKRRKNFVMSKFSSETRRKTAVQKVTSQQKKGKVYKHEAKKRRRKM